MPKEKKGEQVRNKIAYIPDMQRKCLTEDQAKHIYKMVEQNKSVNVHIMKQEIEDDKMVRKTQKEETELNSYQLAILNKKSNEDAKIEQTRWLPSWVKGLSYVEVLWRVNHLSMSRQLCWSFSVVKLLDLYSAYFGTYYRNWLSFTALKMYS